MNKIPCSAQGYSMLSKTLQIGAVILFVIIMLCFCDKGRAHVDLIEPGIGFELVYIKEMERLEREHKYGQTYDYERGTWDKESKGAE